MKFKKSVFIFLLTVLTTITLFLSTIYIYDPLQVFHKTWFNKKTRFSVYMREQDAGIINNYDFNSIILGTSMLKNTSSKEASQLLGGHFVNLSLSGASHNEKSLILDYALKNKKINKVIYSLDYYTYDLNGYPQRMPTYLYDSNYFNDFKIYINDKYLKCIFTNKKSKKCLGAKKSLDRPLADYMEKKNIDRFGGLDKWLNNKTRNNKIRNQKYLDDIVSTAKKVKKQKTKNLYNVEQEFLKQKVGIDKYIIKPVIDNKTTEFIFIFPPNYRYRFAKWAQCKPDKFNLNMKIIEYIVKISSLHKNMKVFGFEDKDFLDDISNYKDTAHYHYSINSQMLNWISKNEGLLTINNLDEYINNITNKALSFDIINLANKIEIKLKNSN